MKKINRLFVIKIILAIIMFSFSVCDGGGGGGDSETSSGDVIAVTGISLSANDINVAMGETRQLIAVITPDNASNRNITWESSDESVAAVSADGEISGDETGIAIISAITDDGNFIDECIVKVLVKVTASDMTREDRFGSSVSVSGNYAIAGAPYEDGGQLNYSDSGAAYIFECQGDGSWTEKARLHASDMTRLDNFGTSVSISGNYAIVGASGEDGGNGDPYSAAGAAYIFKRQSDGTWIEKAILHASDISAGDCFGYSVSISGNYAIVGASGEDGGAGDLYNCAGAAYIFERQSDDTWIEKAVLHASDPAEWSYFGGSVSINGNYAIAGLGRNDLYGPYYGAVYIFERQGDGSWIEKARLQASDKAGYDRFGTSVSISGNYAVAGAFEKDGGTSYSRAGAAYLFERQSDGTWIEKSILHASDMSADDCFGGSVSISGNYAIVGASGEDGGSGDLYSSAGAAYVFERQSDGAWIEKFILHASDLAELCCFGGSVSVNGNYIFVGAPIKESYSGAAYFYTFYQANI